jgi:hypothetical protein
LKKQQGRPIPDLVDVSRAIASRHRPPELPDVYDEVSKETLNKSFDKLRTNGKLLIPFVVSPSTWLRTGLSNALLSEVEGHERNQLVQRFPNRFGPDPPAWRRRRESLRIATQTRGTGDGCP